ncbi:MAG: hypothetical protein A2Y62_20310 [Candidatus Fischerbacteria bacterium RBG_13_37_8]|uniref:Uncharacterized protein n=1 Tax=Candidatus Fischerbacteria bacterium RBG_13_37_8 TaxID=1817863 RepID=A0A1F5VVG8_9BACT|nr:MAG: hypothetical protein A2Y62_20310 [Candidatus Fischerbacteria bacterium RBG_13_37_8]
MSWQKYTFVVTVTLVLLTGLIACRSPVPVRIDNEAIDVTKEPIQENSSDKKTIMLASDDYELTLTLLAFYKYVTLLKLDNKVYE